MSIRYPYFTTQLPKLLDVPSFHRTMIAELQQSAPELLQRLRTGTAVEGALLTSPAFLCALQKFCFTAQKNDVCRIILFLQQQPQFAESLLQQFVDTQNHPYHETLAKIASL